MSAGVYADTSIGGTVKSTFTWVHDTPNDAPPTDVYVLQKGFTTWSLYSNAFPSPLGITRPSIQNVSFPSRRKPRFYLAQTQTGSATADDGLGDAQVMTYDAYQQPTGTSKGYKIVLCHPGTDGTLVVPAVTFSVKVPKPPARSHYGPGLSYSVQVMTLQMTRNGVDITNPNNPEVPVLVGERNAMSVSVSPIPQDVAPPIYKWTIPGDKIKDFIETAGTPFTGKKVELPASDLTTQSPHFYWYNCTFAGDSKEVSVDVTIAGKTITLKGKCKAYLPKCTSFTGHYTTNKPAVQRDSGTRFFRFGSQETPGVTPGVTWDANVEVPNVANAAGTVAFEQLATFDFTAQGVVGDKPYNAQWKGDAAIDTNDVDARYGPALPDPETSERATTPGKPVILTDSDTPGINYRVSDTAVQGNGSFETYLVYKPNSPGSIWIAFGQLNWSWAFNASIKPANAEIFYPHWEITTTAPTTATPQTLTDIHKVLTWSMRGQDVKWTGEPSP